MTETLGDLLRRGADSVTVPRLDVDGLLAEAGKRRRRRRVAMVATAAAAVGAIAVGSALVSSVTQDSPPPSPTGPPTPSESSTDAVDPQGVRPLVYAEGSTVHVGDKTIEARDPVAFIAPTDDGAVYEAQLDGTLWFTDGITTSVIGTSGFTAAPTAHGGVVTTGESGSLVVWGDLAGQKDREADAYVVYDTSHREVVARIPIAGSSSQLIAVGDDEVYFSPQYGLPGCWINDIHTCDDPHLFRFDVASGLVRKIRLAELTTPARAFVDEAGRDLTLEGIPSFRQVGQRLVPLDSNGEPTALGTTTGDEVRLRLPPGYVPPWPADGEGTIAASQWLDDTHVALFADDGGGDLPAKEGDLLVCRLPDGVCRVAVARSSHAYVAPYVG